MMKHKVSFLFFTCFLFGQNQQKIVLWDELEAKPLILFPIAVSDNKIKYSNERGEIAMLSNDSIIVDDGFYNPIYLLASKVNDTLKLFRKTEQLEEILIKTFNNKYLNPFVGNSFKDQNNNVLTFPVGTKHEFVSLVEFNEKYIHANIVEIKARVLLDGIAKKYKPYFRINIYDENKNKIYNSTPFTIDKNKVEITHVLEEDVTILNSKLYVGFEVIGLVSNKGDLIDSDSYYTRLSLHCAEFNEFRSNNYMHSIGNEKMYPLSVLKQFERANFFGFVIK